MKPLNPIMAVLVIASVGASPLRTLAADGDKSAPVAAAEDKNPVNALAKILSENPAARTDAGKRISEFLLDADSNGKSFVGEGVDTKALGAVAREWGESKGSVGSVATLYFVAGPGLAAPGWALKDPVLSKTFVSGMKWEGRLRVALADWTGKSQIDKTKEKSQVTAFLGDAAAKAAAVFSDPRTKEEIDLSVAQNNTTAPVVPDTHRSGTRLDGASRQYTLDDLYRDGAVVQDVSGPGDAGSRRISMKIYTKRLPPPDGRIVNEIGIFDISDTNDIYGQRFPIDSGKQSFALDDRTAGHKKYELTFGAADASGNRTITFARPDEAKKGGGVPLTTSVAELFTKRADQAAAMGNIVKIGGQEFYTLPQGGAKSALALFPKSVIDGRAGAGTDPRDLAPSLYAEVGMRGPDGRNQNVEPGAKGGPHLGTVGDKEYHLVFNKALGVWEVKEGGGDLPAPPAKPTTGDGGSTGGGANPTTPDGGMSIADLETLLLKNPGCTKNPDDTKDLASGLKGQYGVIACSDPRDGLQQIVLVPKSDQNPAQQLKYGNVTGFKLLRARFYDHYLVLQFDKQQQYLDLLKQDKDGDGKETGFAMSGFVADKNASKFSDALAFVDALKNYMGIKTGSPDAGAFAEVPKRVAQVLGSKPYNLTGAFAKDVLVVVATSGGDPYNIWPKIIPPGGDTVPTPNPYTSLSGPANAMDGAVSSSDTAFPPKIELAESRTAKAVKLQTDIALYESEDGPKKYFVMFRYNSLDPKVPTEPNGEKVVKPFRQKAFEVFSSSNPYPGAGLQMQGLIGGTVVKDRVASGYRFIDKSTKERGVLAVFQNKQVSGDNQKDKADNCAGPVIWWGLADRDAALKVCQEDKF
ncbi:MAG: hypothetical protein PHS14_06735 [Elusimicrobia bacterium]|nr:hypothetical protein [Elusimicrobiota bacterium]